MDSNDGIKLDPDVIVNGTDNGIDNAGQVPLSTLYDLPVFGTDTGKKAKEYYAKERDNIERIRKEIFAVHSQAEDEMLEEIYTQVFKAPQILTVTAAKKDGEAETASGTAGCIGWLAVAGAVLLLGLRYIRRIMGAWSCDTDVYGRRQKNGYYSEAGAED